MRVSERQLFVVVVVVVVMVRMELTGEEHKVSGCVYCKHQHPSSIALLLRRDEIACSTLCKCTSRYSNTIFAFSACLTSKRENTRSCKSRSISSCTFSDACLQCCAHRSSNPRTKFPTRHQHHQILQRSCGYLVLLFRKLHVFAYMPMSM